MSGIMEIVAVISALSIGVGLGYGLNNIMPR